MRKQEPWPTTRIQANGQQGSHRDDEAVDEHGYFRLRRSDERPCQRCDLKSTDAHQHVKRISVSFQQAMTSHGPRHHVGLVADAHIIETGARSGQCGRRQRKQGCSNGCCRRRIADAHLAKDENIGTCRRGALDSTATAGK